MEDKNIPKGYGLRIGIKNTNSCGTTSFMMGFDTKKTADDSFLHNGIEILIAKKELLFLVDITLDFEITENISGFKFNKEIA